MIQRKAKAAEESGHSRANSQRKNPVSGITVKQLGSSTSPKQPNQSLTQSRQVVQTFQEAQLSGRERTPSTGLQSRYYGFNNPARKLYSPGQGLMASPGPAEEQTLPNPNATQQSRTEIAANGLMDGLMAAYQKQVGALRQP